MDERDAPARQAEPDDEDERGEPACLAHLVCEACGCLHRPGEPCVRPRAARAES